MQLGLAHAERSYACGLVQACERYEAACTLRSSSHAALYNHGVALSDLARHVR